MHKFIHRNTILPFLAIIFYLVPNLVQDIHRVFGHQHEDYETLKDRFISHDYSAGISFSNQSEGCPICVFEFNVLDEPSKFVYTAVPISFPFVLTTEFISQFQNYIFRYYDLRAPPGLSIS